MRKEQKIEVALNKLQKISNNTKLTEDKLIDSNKYYNCWGFTAFTFKWFNSLKWLDEEEMEFCIDEFTKPVKTPKVGDIMIMREGDGELIHTAILINPDENIIIHKPGGWDLEVDTIKGAKSTYGKRTKISFRRALPDKKFLMREFKKSDYYYAGFGYEWD